MGFPQTAEDSGSQKGRQGAGRSTDQDIHGVMNTKIKTGKGNEKGGSKGKDAPGTGKESVKQQGSGKGCGGVTGRKGEGFRRYLGDQR